MRYLSFERAKSTWLESLLALTILALFFQVFPSLGPWAVGSLSKALSGLVYFLDIRNYSWASWGWMNLVLVLALSSIRFGPDLREAWKKRSNRIAAEKQEMQKKQKLREEREMLERIKESRSRRLY